MGLTIDGWTYLTAATIGKAGLLTRQYAEMLESGRENNYEGNPSAERFLICRWDERKDFYDSLLGWAVASDDNSEFSRGHPDPHPAFRQWYCTDVAATPKGIAGNEFTEFDSQYITSPFAICVATYRPLDYSIGDGDTDYFSFSQEFNTEFLTTQGFLRYANAAAGQPEAIIQATPGILVPSGRLFVTWHNIPGKTTSPFTVPTVNPIRACQGKLNIAPMTFDGILYPKGTLLFEGVEYTFKSTRLDTGIDGRPRTKWDIRYCFRNVDRGLGLVLNGDPNSPIPATADVPADTAGNTENAGWNFRWNPRAGAWIKATYDGSVTGQTLYNYTDLTSLFAYDI